MCFRDTPSASCERSCVERVVSNLRVRARENNNTTYDIFCILIIPRSNIKKHLIDFFRILCDRSSTWMISFVYFDCCNTSPFSLKIFYFSRRLVHSFSEEKRKKSNRRFREKKMEILLLLLLALLTFAGGTHSIFFYLSLSLLLHTFQKYMCVIFGKDSVRRFVKVQAHENVPSKRVQVRTILRIFNRSWIFWRIEYLEHNIES